MNNDQALIAAWLQKNGGARRFETGLSSGVYFAFDYLNERGFKVQIRNGRYFASRSGGRWVRIRAGELQKLVDSERVLQGLPPMRRAYS